MRRLVLTLLLVVAVGVPASARAHSSRGHMPATAIFGDGAVTHDGNRAYASGGGDMVAFAAARTEGDTDAFRIDVGRNAELRRHIKLDVPIVGPQTFDCRTASTLTIVGGLPLNWESMAPGQTTIGHAYLTCLRTRSEGYRIRWTGGPLHGAAGCVRIRRESSAVEFSFSSAGCTAEIRRYADGRFADPVFADVSFSFKARAN